MDRSDLRLEAKRLRSAEPTRAIRGFDEAQTKSLLDNAAKLLEAAANEHEGLARELERTRSEATGKETADQEAIGKALIAATRAADEITAEARAAADRITAEAEARAATIVAESTRALEEREREGLAARERLDSELAAARADFERERERLEREKQSLGETVERERAKALEEARAQAEAMVGDARQEVERLHEHGDRLRTLLADSRREFVALAESALRQLEDAHVTKTGPESGELLETLRPSALEEKPSPTPVAGD